MVRASRDFPKGKQLPKLVDPYKERMRWKRARVCHWCGAPFEGSWPAPLARTREHLIPKSLGGTSDDSNLVAAHLRCNSRRGNSLEWLPYYAAARPELIAPDLCP